MSYFLSAFENSGPRGDRERSPMPLSGVRSRRAIQTLGLSYVNNIDDTAGGSGGRLFHRRSEWAMQIVSPIASRERRKSRALIEGAGIETTKVPLHFALDFIERCFKDHAHILLMTLATVCQRYAGGICAGDDKNVWIHEQIESPVQEWLVGRLPDGAMKFHIGLEKLFFIVFPRGRL